MRRILPTLIALAVLAGLVALFRVAQRFDPSRQMGYGQGPLGDVSIRFEGATIISREAGRTQWSVEADLIELKRTAYGDLENYRAADFTGIKNGVFHRGGKPEAFFSARRATFDQPTQQFTVREKIRLRSAKGDTLESEECVWSEREDFVRLPQGAKGVFSGHKLSAPFLLFSPRKRLVQCPQGAEATLDGNPVHAASMFWDIEKGQVRCPGPVSGTRGSLMYQVNDVEIDLKAHAFHANNGTARLRIEEEGPEGLR
jgi:hypothetical protein